MTGITGLRADKVRIPFRRPFLTSTGLWLEREAWIVRAITSDGRIGVGEAVLEPADGETAHAVLDQLVREAANDAALDELPDVEALAEHGAPGRALGAALEAARLDLDGAAPVLVGRRGPGVGVNATIASVGPSQSAEAALQALAAGFRTVKLKAGAERETEALVDRLRAVRNAVGADVRIRIDVNRAWDAATALERLSAIERFGVEYVEEPLAGGDALELAALRRRVRIPIAADESVSSPRAARELLEAEAVDVLVIKLARVGGHRAATEIAAVASGRGVPAVMSTLFETGVGVAAALAVAAGLPDLRLPGMAERPDHGLATAGLLEHDLLRQALFIENGRMRGPEAEAVRAFDREPGPNGAPVGGLGIELDEAAVRHYAVETIGLAA